MIGMRREDCPFCGRIEAHEYDSRLSDFAVTFEPLNPVVPGHRLFVPTFHHPLPLQMGWVFAEAWRWGTAGMPDFNVIQSNGAHATQTVAHPHVHLVPRHADDGLHLPWTNQRPGPEPCANHPKRQSVRSPGGTPMCQTCWDDFERWRAAQA